jgi:hypothetical protein
MSSANEVELILVPETAYGQAPDPATADAATIRFTTETLSGTPTTTNSAEIRTDRNSGGMVATGFEVGGPITGELSADPAYQYMLESGMMEHWTPPDAPIDLSGAAFAKDGTNPQLATIAHPTDAIGAGLEVGDVILLAGFVDPDTANNGPAQVVSINTSGQLVQVTTKREAVSVTTIPAGVTATRPVWVDIGTETISATYSKAYTDVLHLATDEEHSQRYSGGIVNGFEISLTYGEIVGATFNILANGYIQEHPSYAQAIEDGGGTVEAAGTAAPLNASVDLGMLTVDGLPTDYCIESLKITLDNGNTPQKCIGKLAPTRYNAGTAAITIDATIYLADSSYDAFMPRKLTLDPVGMMFAVGNQDGGYAFDLRAVQLAFPDPSVKGANDATMIEAKGVAKVGPGGASAMRIYSW